MAKRSLPRVAYRGFLSYSHRDSAAAARLHRALETYRIPKQFVADGLPDRLTPIFRDREELSAGTDLSAQVQEALAGSDALIILCSPAAKASKWVNKEIETFRALHPARPILAALLEGEPDDAFPPALTVGGTEPVAADLRKSGDGWRLGRLKLVAGLAKVPLDGLVQRDAQRQLRRVMAITVGALLALLLMAALLVMAIRAQREAERQRAEAEGLVEYMLTDLRDRLKGVGRLDVMTAVNERAMGYYGEGSVRAEVLKARTLHALAEDDFNRGQQKKAEDEIRRSYSITSQILARSPDDVDALFAHSQSSYWMGYAHYVRQDNRGSIKQFVQYRDLARRLRAKEPGKIEWAREVAYAEGNLCSVFLEQTDANSSIEKQCLLSLSMMLAVQKMDPADQETSIAVVNRREWAATALMRVGKKAEALQQRVESRKLLDQMLRKDPRNVDLLQLSLRNRLFLAEALFENSRDAEAQAALADAESAVDGLRQIDPDNQSLDASLGRVGELRRKLERK